MLTGWLTLTEQLADADDDEVPSLEVTAIAAVYVPALANEFEQLALEPEHAPDHE